MFIIDVLIALAIGSLCGLTILSLIAFSIVRIARRQSVPLIPVGATGVIAVLVGLICGSYLTFEAVVQTRNLVRAIPNPVETAGEVVGKTLGKGTSGIADGIGSVVTDRADNRVSDLKISYHSERTEQTIHVVVENTSDEPIELGELVSEGWILGVDSQKIDVFGQLERRVIDGQHIVAQLPAGSRTRHTIRFASPVEGLRYADSEVVFKNRQSEQTQGVATVSL